MTPAKTHAARTILLGTSCLFTAAILTSVAARAGALPSGGVVVGGQATIASGAHSTVINQSTDKAIINWQDFSIASGNSVTFNQPGATSIALNRVLGSTPSTIDGNLFANGHVWLINGNGVLFGKGSQVNVGSLIATTADMANQDFLNGNYKFGSASGNPNAGILNNGLIRANNGSVVLAGPVVTNNGIIQADLGNVTLGGVNTFSVDFQGDNLLRFQIEAPVQQTPIDANGHPVKALVTNTGTISARGGRVLMTTRAAESVVDNVINNTGMVEATSVSQKNGEIVLDAGDGTIEAGGTLDASGRDAGDKGGAITVEARNVVVADGAKLDASGDQGGGSIAIGGSAHGAGPVTNAQNTTVGRATIAADAITKGDGGSVVVWSNNQTKFAGSISARGGAQGGNGGFVETSGGHLDLAKTAAVTTLAPNGITGTWLLDPAVIQIVDGGTTDLNGGEIDVGDDSGATDLVDPDTIIAALGSTNVTLEASSEIDVLSDLVYSSPNTLSLLSEGNIQIEANVENTLNTGGGGINVIAGWDGATLPGSHLTTVGAYGNNFGIISIGGEGSPSASVGAASGVVTLAAAEIEIDAHSGNYAQIGYRGAGGGDINVLSNSNVDLISDGGFAQIGNGAIDRTVAGDITGNISIQTNTDGGGALRFQDNGAGNPGTTNSTAAPNHLWVGNAADANSIESGDLTIVGSLQDEHLAADFGFTGMIVAALGSSSSPGSGGNVFVALQGNSIDLQNDIIYNSPHDLTLLSVYGEQLAASVQNAGDGNLTLVAGWDGTTMNPAHLTNAGVYGNGFGGLGLASSGGNIAFGSKGGTTTVAALDITFNNPDGYTQIGYHGAGTGDIKVFAKGDLDMIGGNAAAHDSVIGNGASFSDVVGDVGGDIAITVGGLTTLAFGGNGDNNGIGGLAWIGNRATGGSKATGNVSLTTGQVTSYGSDPNGDDPNMLSTVMLADLGTSSDTGGNFTLAITAPNSSFLDEYIGAQELNYSSPHNLSLLTTGSFDIAYSIQNSGTGALTILAGWDSQIAPKNALTAQRGFGNNNGVVWVAGQVGTLLDDVGGTNERHDVNSGAGTSVGSRGGVTTVAASQVYVEGLAGYAQIGYHGDGGSGSINVIANGTPGTNGSTGISACFDGNANICLIGGRVGSSDGTTPTYAQIGNLGQDVTGSSTADINVSATGNISISSGGTFDSGSDGEVANSYGLIGSGDESLTTDQTVSGDISVRAGGQVNLFSSDAPNSGAWLGNVTGAGGAQSGDVSIVAASLSDGSAQSRLGSMLVTDLAGGDVTLGLTGNQNFDLDDTLDYTSAHRLSLLSVGGLTLGGSIQNTGTGEIDLVAGWDGTTLDAAHLTDAGVFGNNSGNLVIGGTSAAGDAFAGTKGTLRAAAHNVTVEADNGAAQLGLNGSGSGDIDVSATNRISVLGNLAGSSAQIGNGLFDGGNGGLDTGAVGGDIDLSAPIVEVRGLANNATVRIGNGANGAHGNIGGDITIDSQYVFATSQANNDIVQIGNGGGGGVSGQIGGDIAITATTQILAAAESGGTSSSVIIGNGGPDVNGIVSGSIDIASNVVSADVFQGGANSGVQIGNGGVRGNGTFSGDITITGNELFGTTADAGSVRIGNGGDSSTGSASGNITVTLADITGNKSLIDLSAGAGSSTVSIGNGGYAANAMATTGYSDTGDITLTASDISLSTFANLTAVGIGNGDVVGGTPIGATSGPAIDGDVLFGGDITLNARRSLDVSVNGFYSAALIGNGGFGALDNASITGSATTNGNIAVNVGTHAHAGSMTVSIQPGSDPLPDGWSFGDGSLFQLGNGISDSAIGATATDGITDTGSIAVNVLGGSTHGGLAQFDNEAPDGSMFVGNGGLDAGANVVGGDIRFNVDGNLTGSAGLSPVIIGNMVGSGGTETGNVLVTAWDASGLEASMQQTLGGGDFTARLLDTSGTFALSTDVNADSSHRLKILSAGGIDVLASIQNAGDGAIDLVAGWDGITTSTADLSNDGVFGNNGGSVIVGGDNANGDARIGSAGGLTTVLGDTVVVSAQNGDAQIGYAGQSTGGIDIRSRDDVLVLGQGQDTAALIGNGGLAATGDILGNIDIASGGQITVQTGDQASIADIGNLGGNGSSETGDITLDAAGALNLSAGIGSLSGIGNWSVSGTGAASAAGNIDITSSSLNVSSSGADAFAQIGNGRRNSTVSGDITINTGDVDVFAEGNSALARIGSKLLNEVAVSGDITLNAAGNIVLSTAGTGDDAGANAIIGFGVGGSIDGNLSVTATNGGSITESAAGDYSQTRIGNAATLEMSGNTNVVADSGVVVTSGGLGSVALITAAGSTVTGDISVQSLSGPVLLAASGSGSTAQIGASASESVDGDVTVTALGSDGGGVTLLGAGEDTNTLIGSYIAAADQDTISAGTVEGDITVNTTLLSLASDSGGAVVQIGDGARDTRTSSVDGNILINAGTASIFTLGSSTVRIGHYTEVAGGSVTGDIDVNVAGSLSIGAGLETSATGGSAVIGSDTVNNISGNINVTTTNGGAVSLANDGQDAQVRIGNTGNVIDGDATVTADGSLTVASLDGGRSSIGGQADNVTGNIVAQSSHGVVILDAEGDASTAQVGNTAGSVEGGVTVHAMNSKSGAISLTANGDGASAEIGNMLFAAPGAPAGEAGAVSVQTTHVLSLAASGDNALAQIGNSGAGIGAISVQAHDLTLGGDDSQSGLALIGNNGGGSGDIGIRIAGDTTFLSGTGRGWIGNLASNGATSGALSLISGDIDDRSEGNGLRDMLVADVQNGDVMLGLTAASQVFGPDSPVLYESSHAFSFLASGDVVLGGSLQNSGTGAINIVAGWNGETLDPTQFGNENVSGLQGHGVTIGLLDDSLGDDASGVSVGSQGGSTSVYGAFLTLSATRGYAQLGYHGGGTGSVFVGVTGDVDLTGGSADDAFAQIGNGGLGTVGSNEGAITIDAVGNVNLTGGEGDEAYVQIGHGGAESNTGSQGYHNTGAITINGANVVMTAGTGDTSYVQIGHGGYKVGANLTGASENSGDIAIGVQQAVTLVSSGDDAYAQIGNGGDQLNTNAAANATGAISGDINVTAPNGTEGSINMTSGAGVNAYVQIGNGGYSINAPTPAIADNFTTSGNITVSDLALSGGSGANSFAMIGNGDNAQSGVSNVSGDIFIQIGQGTVSLTDGSGSLAGANIHNATGRGTVSGSIFGFTDPRLPPPDDGDDTDVNSDPDVKGVIVDLITNTPPPVPPVNEPLPDVILSTAPPLTKTDAGPAHENPIEEMGGNADEQPSDKAAESIGDSLSGGKQTTSHILLGGILRQQNLGGQSSKPHAVPKADEDYSSWGNEAFWQ